MNGTRIQLPHLSDTTRKGGIYIVRFSDTHYYGGRAKQFRSRWRRHLTCLEQGKHPNSYMQAVFNKYHRFDPEILSVVPLDQQVVAEGVWLGLHFGEKGCLNLSESPRNNTYVSAEARQKISKANKGRKQTPEAIRRSAESRRGLKQSDEAKRNNSLAQTGKIMSPEACAKMSQSSARKGKSIHESLRKAIVAANHIRKGEVRSPEVRSHLSRVVSGLFWVCHDGQCRRVPSSEIDDLLGQGWQRGRKYKPC